MSTETVTTMTRWLVDYDISLPAENAINDVSWESEDEARDDLREWGGVGEIVRMDVTLTRVDRPSPELPTTPPGSDAHAEKIREIVTGIEADVLDRGYVVQQSITLRAAPRDMWLIRRHLDALSYQVYPCDREVVIRAHLDTALYRKAYVDGRGQTTELAVADAADAADQADALRNGKPRLVSITVIAERWIA